MHRNVLDVSFHVTQYQNIISELKGEIGRLKDKISLNPVIKPNLKSSVMKFIFSGNPQAPSTNSKWKS